MRRELWIGVLVLTATPALAQIEPQREWELGVGWFQDNPLDVDDIHIAGSGPTVELAWAKWRNERTGYALGVMVWPGSAGWVRRRHVHVAPLATWRWRWLNTDGQGFFHAGVGAGPGFRQTGGEFRLDFLLWHVEAMVTRPWRGVDVRAGVRVQPLLAVPVAVQPVVMIAR